MHIDLHHILAGPVSGIGNRYVHLKLQLPIFVSHRAQSAHVPIEGGIAEAVAEGVDHLFRVEGLEILVAKVNALFICHKVVPVDIPVLPGGFPAEHQTAAAAGGRVVIEVADDLVHEPARGVYVAIEQVQQSLLAPVAGPVAGIERAADFLRGDGIDMGCGISVPVQIAELHPAVKVRQDLLPDVVGVDHSAVGVHIGNR